MQQLVECPQHHCWTKIKLYNTFQIIPNFMIIRLNYNYWCFTQGSSHEINSHIINSFDQSQRSTPFEQLLNSVILFEQLVNSVILFEQLSHLAFNTSFFEQLTLAYQSLVIVPQV